MIVPLSCGLLGELTELLTLYKVLRQVLAHVCVRQALLALPITMIQVEMPKGSWMY